MEQISTTEQLNKYALQTARKLVSTEVPYEGNFLHGTTWHKRTFYIPYNSDSDIHLVGYSDPKSISKDNLFFGVFFTLDFPLDEKMLIRKKFITDRLKPLITKQPLHPSLEQFSNSVVIKTTSESLLLSVFKDFKLQNIISDLMNTEKSILVGINECHIDFVPGFADQSHFGIYTRLKWMVEPDFIELLFSSAEKIRSFVILKSSE